MSLLVQLDLLSLGIELLIQLLILGFYLPVLLLQAEFLVQYEHIKVIDFFF